MTGREPDPFRSLRTLVRSSDPDPAFVETLMRDVHDRLDQRPRPAGPPDDRTEITLDDARVVVVDARRRRVNGAFDRRFAASIALGAAAVVVLIVTLGALVVRTDRSGPADRAPAAPTPSVSVPPTISVAAGEADVARRSVFDGLVTFDASASWERSIFNDDHSPTADTFFYPTDCGPHSCLEGIVLVLDPLPMIGCEPGSDVADAATFVQLLEADPNLDVSNQATVRVGESEALRVDIDNPPGAAPCRDGEEPGPAFTHDQPGDETPVLLFAFQRRMRVYVFDVPGEPGQVLAVAINASESTFDQVADAAVPLIESLEFHPVGG